MILISLIIHLCAADKHIFLCQTQIPYLANKHDSDSNTNFPLCII